MSFSSFLAFPSTLCQWCRNEKPCGVCPGEGAGEVRWFCAWPVHGGGKENCILRPYGKALGSGDSVLVSHTSDQEKCMREKLLVWKQHLQWSGLLCAASSLVPRQNTVLAVCSHMHFPFQSRHSFYSPSYLDQSFTEGEGREWSERWIHSHISYIRDVGNLWVRWLFFNNMWNV